MEKTALIKICEEKGLGENLEKDSRQKDVAYMV